MKPISLLNTYTSPFSNCNKQLFLLNKLNLALISGQQNYRDPLGV